MKPTAPLNRGSRSSTIEMGISMLFVLAAFILATAIGPPGWNQRQATAQQTVEYIPTTSHSAHDPAAPASVRLTHRSQ